MITIKTLDVESIIVGKYNGTLEKAKEYITSIILKHVGEEYLYIEEKPNSIFISIDSNKKKRFSFDPTNPYRKTYHHITEELANIGDVRGDYALDFLLEEEQIVEPDKYIKIGTYFS